MFDDFFWFILFSYGINVCFLLFVLFVPSKQKWILEVRHAILFKPKERQDKLLHMLKETFRKRTRKKK